MACEGWLEFNPTASDRDDGRRLAMIKREIEEWLERNERLQPHDVAPASVGSPTDEW